MRLSLALACLSALPAAAQTTWIVDDDGGPGVDFTDLDPAVAAAADGDLLLVRPGSYSDLVLSAKGLTIAADPPLLATVAGASVRNLAAGQRVRLDGLVIQSPTEAGLQVKTNLGLVRIEDCQVLGADGNGVFTSPSQHPDGHPGLQVVDAARVTVARCELRGGRGDDYAPLFASPGGGGPGIEVAGAGSGLAVFDSLVVGGHAGDVIDDDAAWDGPTGGHGMLVSEGELFLVGNLLVSGAGGHGGEDFDIFSGYVCGNGGDAGDGIAEPWPGTGQPLLHLAHNSFTSGAPGQPFVGSGCVPGQLGSMMAAGSAIVDPMAVGAFGLQVTDPVREGETIAVTVHGPPAAVVWLALAADPGWLHLPLGATGGGLAVVDPLGYQLLALGTTDGGGFVTGAFPAPALVPAGQGLDLFLQVVGFEPATGQLSLGSPAGLLLLDSSL